MGFFQSYSSSKLKSQLKMAVHRFQINSNKKSALLKQQKREIANLLVEDPPKEEKARIRAESLIREDNTIEAYEILQLSCELLAERLQLISSTEGCPPDLVGTISSLIWASNRVDITELVEIKKQFKLKYGKKFEEDAMMNAGGVINERILVKLSVQPPSAMLVQAYLQKIAEEFEVDWKPQQQLNMDQLNAPMEAPIGYSVSVASGSGLGGAHSYHNGSNDGNNGSGGGGGGGGCELPILPVVMGVPPLPTAPSSRFNSNNPGKTNQPPDEISYSNIPPAAPGSTASQHDKTDGNDNNDTSSTKSSQYDDIEARFQRLNSTKK